jgi:hypothetical protein
MFRSAARVFLQQQQHQRRIQQLLLQRIHHHPDRVVVIHVRRSSTEDTSDDRPSSSSSTNVILPSTDGLEEWRTKNSSSTSGSGTIDSITAEATPIFLSYQVQEMYDPEIHLPSAPIDWTGYEPSTPISDEITALIGVTGRYVHTIYIYIDGRFVFSLGSEELYYYHFTQTDFHGRFYAHGIDTSRTRILYKGNIQTTIESG